MKRSFLSLAVAAVVLSGCSLIPDYQRPEAPVAAAYPQGQAYGQNTGAAAVPAADIGWREFFRDPQLQQLIGVALENNRDLRVAALNVEAFRRSTASSGPTCSRGSAWTVAAPASVCRATCRPPAVRRFPASTG